MVEPDLDASIRSKLDTTVIIDAAGGSEECEGKHASPLFALVSLNEGAAPSCEVPWSQLLALSLKAESEPFLLTIGRRKDCTLRLEDPRVSQVHFEIASLRKPGSSLSSALMYECALNDRSSNGTSVNGSVVGKGNSQQLRSGDEIEVLQASKVGADKRIAFMFRNSTEVLASPKGSGKQLELEEHICCPICFQATYKCVALMPCLHNFCMSCYSDWMVIKDDCPVCRQLVTAVVRNHPMDAVCDAFLEAMPERRRPPEELQGMDKKDRIRLAVGGKIVRSTASVGTSTQSALPSGRRSTASVGSGGSPSADMAASPAGSAAPPAGNAAPPAGIAAPPAGNAALPQVPELDGPGRHVSADDILTRMPPRSSSAGTSVCVLQ